ncbi:LOW QUALITY PROTEIN: hypothetical protein CRUP_009494 [Coryphaenoides rupestris]|nr:LOW QUALITY PROTEIN: hypothetical protein CRUP_009494 [Coryphaenoides rupestris]
MSTASLDGAEHFMDILEDLRRSGDLGHAFRSFKPPVATSSVGGPLPCTAADLSATVLKSQHLRYVAKEVAAETGSSVEAVEEQAGAILREMSQNLQLSSIRLLGYAFSKTMRRLYTGVHVNMDGLDRLRQATQEHPVILMPNHRSYMDFLIISYLMFTYDLPIPLYWAVLSEYVKTIVRTGYAPLEFYVEGLRSRTLKALPPKLGEPLSLLPKTFQNLLMITHAAAAAAAHGLLKARSILQENYGSMHVNFGQPLSVRQLCLGRFNRHHYNLIPRDLPQRPREDMQACVSWLAHRVVRAQERGSVLSPWSLMACALLQVPAATLVQEGLAWETLARSTLWLRRLALDCGAHLNWPSEDTRDWDEVMSSSMALHRSVVRRKGGRVFLAGEEGFPERRPIGAEEEEKEEGVARRAVAVLMVSSYRNQALHVFARPAMLAVAMHVTASRRRSELQAFFVFLLDVFSNEFIFTPGQSSQDFEDACSLLEKVGAIQSTQEEILVTEEGPRTLRFLETLLRPFLDAYQGVHTFSDKQFVTAVRKLATRHILAGELQTYEALSSETQKNTLSSLLRLEALTKLRTDERTEYSVKKSSVRRIGDVLCGKVPLQSALSPPDARL